LPVKFTCCEYSDKIDLNGDVVKKSTKLQENLPEEPEISSTANKHRRWLFALLVIALLIIAVSLSVRQALAGEVPADTFSGNNVSAVTRFLGALHPLSVHFPLALIFAAFGFELLFIKSNNQKWRTSASHTLTLGAVISLATITLGLMASEVGPFLGADAELLWTHRLFGLLASGLALTATYTLAQSRLAKKNRPREKMFALVYRVTLALAVVAVFIAGNYGAKLSGM